MLADSRLVRTIARNLEHNTHSREHKDNTGAAVAHKWQGNTLQGQQADHGADVDKRLDTQPAQSTGNE